MWMQLLCCLCYVQHIMYCRTYLKKGFDQYKTSCSCDGLGWWMRLAYYWISERHLGTVQPLTRIWLLLGDQVGYALEWKWQPIHFPGKLWFSLREAVLHSLWKIVILFSQVVRQWWLHAYNYRTHQNVSIQNSNEISRVDAKNLE